MACSTSLVAIKQLGYVGNHNYHMPDVEFQVTLPVPVDEAFAWHARSGALQRLMPPWKKIIHASTPAPGCTSIIQNGGIVTFSQSGLPFKWVAEHENYKLNESFTDTQKSGPFSAWRHQHIFIENNGACQLTDRISYKHGLATAVFQKRISNEITRLFAFRHHRTTWDLERHKAAQLPPTTIAVTGGSGFIGSALIPFFTTGGHTVRTVGRKNADIPWDLKNGQLSQELLAPCDAVIHLAGENVAQRWTKSAKERIRDSRVKSTALLAHTLAKLQKPPRVLIIASGIGYYGTHTDDRARDESALVGEDFLADVCREWESAAEPARQAGIRVVHVRTGMVVASAGGALKKMLPAFRCGAGGPIGSGQQWQSWIHRDDLIDIFHRALYDDDMHGHINAVAPEVVRQIDFARTLGQATHRPTFAPLPAFVVKLLFGEMGTTLLLQGARIVPARLLAMGHRWRYPTLSEALQFEV